MKSALMALALMAVPLAVHAAPTGPTPQAIKHGQWLVNIAGCNDCHTPGWGNSNGHAPKDRLLVGGGLAFQGPWGTTFPINLRLLVQSMDVEQWIHMVRTTRARPLMPWWAFRYMSNYDVASIYYYIRSLGPAGKPAHPYVPTGKSAPPPYLKLVLPAQPGAGAARG